MTFRSPMILAALLSASLGVSAQTAPAPAASSTSEDHSAHAAAATAPAAKSATGLKAELENELSAVEKKLVALAGAVPQEKYTWRPAEGVRSIAEVYLHVAQGNYLLGHMAGGPVAEGVQLKGMDKSTTDKEKIVAELKRSFEYMHSVVENTADFDKQVKWFGGSDKSARMALIYTVIHQSEHLGQSIAYARSVGVTPPWSEAQTKKDSETPKEKK